MARNTFAAKRTSGARAAAARGIEAEPPNARRKAAGVKVMERIARREQIKNHDVSRGFFMQRSGSPKKILVLIVV
jgi:hypothetical protein